jgi:hypothetical protein
MRNGAPAAPRSRRTSWAVADRTRYPAAVSWWARTSSVPTNQISSTSAVSARRAMRSDATACEQRQEAERTCRTVALEGPEERAGVVRPSGTACWTVNGTSGTDTATNHTARTTKRPRPVDLVRTLMVTLTNRRPRPDHEERRCVPTSRPNPARERRLHRRRPDVDRAARMPLRTAVRCSTIPSQFISRFQLVKSGRQPHPFMASRPRAQANAQAANCTK